MSNLIIGVDGGGTKTHALVAEVHNRSMSCILGSGLAPGSNPLSVGWESAIQNIRGAVSEAINNSKADGHVESAVLAIAGCNSKQTRDQLQEKIGELIGVKDYAIVPDTAPIFSEATDEQPTIGVIAGTGSAIIVRSEDGELSTYGGWGYLLGDEGSGYALGREALRQLLEQREKSDEQTSYENELSKNFCLSSPSDVKSWVYNAIDSRQTIASLAKLVLELAVNGNDQAMQIVSDETNKLAQILVRATCDEDFETPHQLILTGSLMEKSSYYRQAFLNAIKSTEGYPEPTSIKLAPIGACGCLRLAATNK